MPCPIITLQACVINNCSTFQITIASETTVDFTALSYTSAIVRITNLYTNTDQDYDVLAFLPASLTTPTVILNGIFTGYEDGMYKIELILEGPECPMTIESRVFSLCESRCCVDKMWAKYKVDSSCKCSSEAMKLPLEGEGLYQLLLNSSSCMNEDAVKEILKKLQRLCSLEKCNCKCN